MKQEYIKNKHLKNINLATRRVYQIKTEINENFNFVVVIHFCTGKAPRLLNQTKFDHSFFGFFFV